MWGRWGSFKMPFSLTRQPRTPPSPLHPPCLHRLHLVSDSLLFLSLCFCPFHSFWSPTHTLLTVDSSDKIILKKDTGVTGVRGSLLILQSWDKPKTSQSLKLFLPLLSLPFLPKSTPLPFCRPGCSLLRHLSSLIIFWIPLLSPAVSHYLFCFRSNKRDWSVPVTVFLLFGLDQPLLPAVLEGWVRGFGGGGGGGYSNKPIPIWQLEAHC